jgi:hypothetical protein
MYEYEDEDREVDKDMSIMNEYYHTYQVTCGVCKCLLDCDVMHIKLL